VAGLGKECFCEQARKQGINAVEKVESMGDALEFPMQSLSLAVFDQLHHLKQSLLLRSRCIILHHMRFFDHITLFASCHRNKPTIPRPKEPIDTYRKPSEEDISCCLG
jgi:hypothetical protein